MRYLPGISCPKLLPLSSSSRLPRVTSSPRISRQAGPLCPSLQTPTPGPPGQGVTRRRRGRIVPALRTAGRTFTGFNPNPKRAARMISSLQSTTSLLLTSGVCPFSASRSPAGSLGDEAQVTAYPPSWAPSLAFVTRRKMGAWAAQPFDLIAFR